MASRAFDRVYCHVHRRAAAVAHRFAVEEHRGFVLRALADDDDAVHVHGGEHQTHGLDGGAISGFFLPAPHPVGGGQRGGFGDADEFEGEVTIRSFAHLISDC